MDLYHAYPIAYTQRRRPKKRYEVQVDNPGGQELQFIVMPYDDIVC